MLTALFLFCALIFLAAYFSYGTFLAKQADIDPARPTPAHSEQDGVDRVPAPPAVLLGHHFSSIAGAGPIVGPIIAALAFGWLPVLLWIVLGSIFIGGTHDFFSLIASIRHHARSIAEIAKEYISPLSYKLFLIFIWVTLVYVLAVFTDLTAETFTADPGVASASVIFVALAIGFGLSIYRLKVNLKLATLIFVSLLFAAIALGHKVPLEASMLPSFLGEDPSQRWRILLALYCFVAAVLPVWLLLQPRDYLSSYLLYVGIVAAFVGICLGGFAIEYPALKGWSSPELGPLLPILFITVACGACSGFHSLVSSGTSSKQLNKESDARLIGYGSMLIEGLVAVVATLAVAMLLPGDVATRQPPPMVYGISMGKFLATVGVPEKLGVSFGLLTLSAFILTTLDTATRLARYVMEEFFNWRGRFFSCLATLLTLLPLAALALMDFRGPDGELIPAWKIIWPVFGVSNQLLAALALLVIAVWRKKAGKRVDFVAWPMIFMAVMATWSLILLIGRHGFSPIGAAAALLLGLTLFLIFEAARALRPAHVRAS
ncbi:MAG: carbon starvation protein A [Deltaproteobacteria bacterium]|nr:carbon starvation protein A [Deltaproteobacteria bacterium]